MFSVKYLVIEITTNNKNEKVTKNKYGEFNIFCTIVLDYTLYNNLMILSNNSYFITKTKFRNLYYEKI
jgi:hypothetical protein